MSESWRAIRPTCFVKAPLIFYDDVGLCEHVEALPIEKLVLNASIEALDVAILLMAVRKERLPGLQEVL